MSTPSTRGCSLGNKSVRFNIAWRSERVPAWWRPTHSSIPYAGGSRIAMPVVLLESISTGRRAWFANFHNPADTPNLGNNVTLAGRGGRPSRSPTSPSCTQGRRHPGDRRPATTTSALEIFCRFTAGGAFFTAAAGGSSPPAAPPPPSMEVDWVFGSTGVAFNRLLRHRDGRGVGPQHGAHHGDAHRGRQRDQPDPTPTLTAGE